MAVSRKDIQIAFSWRLLVCFTVAILLQMACSRHQSASLPPEKVQRWIPVLAELSVVHTTNQPDSVRDSLYLAILQEHGLTPSEYQQFHRTLLALPASRQRQILRQVDRYVQALIDSLQALPSSHHGE